ncbi:hypothetical protein QEZ54_09360 [Catellatospora sp. KI3]|uniref:hypothetical protein n=1 Tax=Catellatospora sp. KI3 TaxID=3041620 RepID=UPI002482F840|nr:hypothetical protein [Catellatospora sp. KI3]MDI1461172.1 hypothetical protein [Catellatospora sp. KI3]
MRLHRATALLASAITFASLALAPTAAGADPDLFYSSYGIAKAHEVKNNLNLIGWPGENAYNYYPGKNGHPSSSTNSVVWGTPGSPYTYEAKTTCAPFVTLSLKAAYGWADDTYFSTYLGSTSPTSAQYYAKFTAGTVPNLDRRTKVTELVPGDLIAIKYSGSDSSAGDPTGHTAFYAGRTQVERDGDAATVEWAVSVVDSTSNPHGVASTNPASPYLNFPDTRAVGATEYDGVGQGYLVIQADATGTVLGYWWGINENLTSQFHAVADRPIAFAHIVAAA